MFIDAKNEFRGRALFNAGNRPSGIDGPAACIGGIFDQPEIS